MQTEHGKKEEKERKEGLSLSSHVFQIARLDMSE